MGFGICACGSDRGRAGEPPSRPSALPARRRPARARGRRGFTLLELLVALVIFVTAFTIVAMTFNSTINAWERGNKVLANMHHGDFVMEQLVTSLRSAAFFSNNPKQYGFWLDPKGGDPPQDTISWVTSSSAFMRPGSPYENSLHRIEVTVDEDEEGREGFIVKAWPHLADEDELEDLEIEALNVSARVRGFECRFWDGEKESWEEDWEDTNALPGIVQVTLYLEPPKKHDDMLTMKRMVELPMAYASTSGLARAAMSPTPDGTNAVGRGPGPGGGPRMGPGGGMRMPGQDGVGLGGMPGGANRIGGGSGPTVRRSDGGTRRADGPSGRGPGPDSFGSRGSSTGSRTPVRGPPPSSTRRGPSSGGRAPP